MLLLLRLFLDVFCVWKFVVFLVLHATVLKPNLYLPLAELQVVRYFNAPLARQVPVCAKLLLELAYLKLGVGGPLPLVGRALAVRVAAALAARHPRKHRRAGLIAAAHVVVVLVVARVVAARRLRARRRVAERVWNRRDGARAVRAARLRQTVERNAVDAARHYLVRSQAGHRLLLRLLEQRGVVGDFELVAAQIALVVVLAVARR